MDVRDQWVVVDRWWTETPEKRLFCELVILDEQKIVLRFDYNHEKQKFELVGEVE